MKIILVLTDPAIDFLCKKICLQVLVWSLAEGHTVLQLFENELIKYRLI